MDPRARATIAVILVDTSIWIDHFKSASPILHSVIADDLLVTHDFVIAELAMGHVPKRELFLSQLRLFPRLPMVDETEFLNFVEQKRLSATGIGMCDAHMLASISRVPEATLWTGDRRLRTQAGHLGVRCLD